MLGVSWGGIVPGCGTVAALSLSAYVEVAFFHFTERSGSSAAVGCWLRDLMMISCDLEVCEAGTLCPGAPQSGGGAGVELVSATSG